MMIDSLASSHRGMSLADLAHVLPVLLLGFGWPCFLLAAGANTVANEMAEGTLGFLLSRPVSRARLWSASRRCSIQSSKHDSVRGRVASSFVSVPAPPAARI